MSSIQADIETRLAERAPDVEVLLAELHGDTVELYIDHPDGVTLDVCERVTHALPELRAEHGLTVSSPGPERPLTKPEHFRRFLGNTVRVKTSEEIAGRHSFTGTLTAADDEQVSVEAPDGAVTIPLQSVRRSNLVQEEVA
jgi:ribosome maturation factor RimP